MRTRTRRKKKEERGSEKEERRNKRKKTRYLQLVYLNMRNSKILTTG